MKQSEDDVQDTYTEHCHLILCTYIKVFKFWVYMYLVDTLKFFSLTQVQIEEPVFGGQNTRSVDEILEQQKQIE